MVRDMVFLQIHNRYLMRGGEDECAELEARLLAEQRHKVVGYCEDNRRIESMGKVRAALRAVWSAETARRVSAIALRSRPDIALVHNFFPLISPSLHRTCRRLGIPVVQYVHNYRLFCPSSTLWRNGRPCRQCLGWPLAVPGVVHGCYRGSVPGSVAVAGVVGIHRMIRTWTTCVDMYVAVSEFAADICRKGGLPPERVCVMPNAVHPDPGVGAGNGGYLVFVGRLTAEKGVGTLLKAWSGLEKRAALKIVGDGPERRRLQAEAAGMPGVEWLGARPLPETLDIIGGATALVFPSEWPEPFGRVVIEAYAKGTPVVASRVGATGELVDDGETGFLCQAGDPAALGARLAEVLRMPEDARLAMRARARKRYEERYTGLRNHERRMQIVDRVLRHGTTDVSARDRKPSGGRSG